MKKALVSLAVAAALGPVAALADGPDLQFTKVWTYALPDAEKQTLKSAEIPAYDAKTGTLWVVGVTGVDVLDAATGVRVESIDTSTFGYVNSVTIRNGLAALAIEAVPARTLPGLVVFFDTRTRKLANGINQVPVGALPDMLTFTPDGKRIVVANEATPTTYGARLGTTVPRVYGPAAVDPAGSVSIIDVESRSVVTTAGLAGVPTSGSNLRTQTGMDFEPEYIAVDKRGDQAYVTLQEANAIGVLDLRKGRFTRVIGLGAKDFSLPGNQIDPFNNGVTEFISPAVKGLYMPDTIASYQWRGRTLLVMANEGDFREDDGDRSTAGSLGATPPLVNLRVSNTDSSAGNYFAAGARSFSIRDTNGTLIYDSGDILDKEAAARGVYDDGRSRDKGVEPEGVALLELGDRTFAFIGLERTTSGAVAVFDVTNPYAVRFIDMLVTAGDVAPEGLAVFKRRGNYFLAIANETSKTTTLYQLTSRGDGRDDDRDEDDRDDDERDGRDGRND